MALKELKVGQPKIDEALADVYSALRALQRVQLLAGHELEVTFTAGPGLTQRIVHRLGKAWQGYILTDATAAVTIFRDNLDKENPKVDFYLTSSAPAVVTLWVF